MGLGLEVGDELGFFLFQFACVLLIDAASTASGATRHALTATQSTITVQVTLSEAGSVYCAATRDGFPIPTVTHFEVTLFRCDP